MQLLGSLLLSGIVAAWIAAIAILAVQNATPISLHFLTFSSVKMPLGLALAFCSAIGILVGSLTYPFRGWGQSRRSTQD